MADKVKEAVDKDGAHHSWLFYCPGCDEPHQVDTRWQFNGSVDKPTFTPSVLVTGKYGEEQRETRCHSFVRNGQIEYLGDCTHSLKGQTVSVPDWKAW